MQNILSESATHKKILGSLGGALPNPDTVLGHKGAGRFAAYRKLLNDPHTWSCVQSRKSGVLSQSLSPPDVIEQDTTLEKCLEHIDIHAFAETVLDAVLYGYQPIELIWQKGDGYLYPIPKAKPQEWFAFGEDGSPEFALGPQLGQKLPEHKFLFPTYKGSYVNPYGTGLLSKCYWPVSFKNGGLRFWATYMERYGMPTVLGRYERGSTLDEAKELAEHLSGMSQDAVIVAPSDVSLQMVEPNRHGSVELFEKMVENCNSEISKAILSQTLTTEIDVGSRAAAEIHFKVRGEIVESDMRFVRYWIKELMKTCTEVNRIYS